MTMVTGMFTEELAPRPGGFSLRAAVTTSTPSGQTAPSHPGEETFEFIFPFLVNLLNPFVTRCVFDMRLVCNPVHRVEARGDCLLCRDPVVC